MWVLYSLKLKRKSKVKMQNYRLVNGVANYICLKKVPDFLGRSWLGVKLLVSMNQFYFFQRTFAAACGWRPKSLQFNGFPLTNVRNS